MNKKRVFPKIDGTKLPLVWAGWHPVHAFSVYLSCYFEGFFFFFWQLMVLIELQGPLHRFKYVHEGAKKNKQTREFSLKVSRKNTKINFRSQEKIPNHLSVRPNRNGIAWCGCSVHSSVPKKLCFDAGGTLFSEDRLWEK